MEGKTPIGVPLSGYYKESFAYPSLKDRLPVIISKIVDTLHRMRDEILEEVSSASSNDIKTVTNKLSCLRYELSTNKELRTINDSGDDGGIWNDFFKKESKVGDGDVPRWFATRWLYAETYCYRRIQEAFLQSPGLQSFDYFKIQKKSAFDFDIAKMETLAKICFPNLLQDGSVDSQRSHKLFDTFVKLSLWGNRSDLSFHSGEGSEDKVMGEEILSSLRAKIIVDDSLEAWKALNSKAENLNVIDIVMDNSGLEWFTDLFLADFILSRKLVEKVRFRIKCFPWFVSDVQGNDFDWMINELSKHKSLNKVRQRWEGHIKNGSWIILKDKFWTYPHDFSKMNFIDEKLYADLGKSKLIIFKGDLNYRKLLGDINWDTASLFSDALRGFAPGNILALRTLKSDTVVGLKNGQEEELKKKDSNWMINGKWGLISFASKDSITPL